MPGTNHFDAIELTFTKRSADMRAIVIDGMKRTGNIEQRYLFTTHFDQLGLAGRNFISFGNFHKLWHTKLLMFTFTEPAPPYQCSCAFDVAVRVGGLIECESAIDMRPNPTFLDSTHDFARPTRDLLAFAPHMTQVQCRTHPCFDSSARADETLGVCARAFKTRSFPRMPEAEACGHSEHSHAPGCAQGAIASLPTRSAQRIDN